MQKSDEPRIKVVIDTNVLVPSIYYTTPLARFLLSGNLILIWNNFIYNEAQRIIKNLSKSLRSSNVNSELALELLNIFADLGYKVPDMPSNWSPVSPDRNDDPFLWAAIRGNAEFIISEDTKHLLNLNTFRNIPIGKPSDFFRWAIANHPMPARKKRFSNLPLHS